MVFKKLETRMQLNQIITICWDKQIDTEINPIHDF